MSLFEDFDEVSAKQWQDRIIKDLKGKDYNENLLWNSPEDIIIKPFYNSEDLANTVTKNFELSNNESTWQNQFVVAINSCVEANRKALWALNRGVNSILFTGNIPTQTDFNILLENIDLTCINLHFYNSEPNKIEQFYSDYLLNKNIKLNNITNSISYDYIGEILNIGNWKNNQQKDIEELSDLLKSNNQILSIAVNGKNFNNSGATITQELAFSFSLAVEYITQLSNTGIPLKDCIDKMIFRFGIGPNYFFEIAKIRAAKILWLMITKEYDINQQRMHIHSFSTTTTISNLAPHTNILRTTTEAMSAILGGANSISVLPFDSDFETQSELAERVAINIQHILKEESFLDKVNDIASGSYYIEKLTDELVEKSLALFKETEALGGFLACIKSGFIQQSITQNANKQIELFKNGKRTLLGVTKHQDKTTPIPPIKEKSVKKDTPFATLNPINFSEEYLSSIKNTTI